MTAIDPDGFGASHTRDRNPHQSSAGGRDDTEGYSVEAEYDAESDMYLADFDLKRCDAFLIIPILVQVIGADGKASKAKSADCNRRSVGCIIW